MFKVTVGLTMPTEQQMFEQIMLPLVLAYRMYSVLGNQLSLSAEKLQK